MKTLQKYGVKALIISSMLLFGLQAQAYKFSTSKVELLHGNYEERSGSEQQLFTFANATGFSKGDTFFFIDVDDFGNASETGGIHAEFNARVSIPRTFGVGLKGGVLKDTYLVGQLDFDGNAFNRTTSHMAGIGADWKVPGFRFVKTNLLHRDDPGKSGSSAQFQLIWNKGFNLGKHKFSFEGFADWTSGEGDNFPGNANVTNFHTQPVLLWHATKNLGLGLEYQYWNNRIGRDDLDESTPQLLLRFTF